MVSQQQLRQQTFKDAPGRLRQRRIERVQERERQRIAAAEQKERERVAAIKARTTAVEVNRSGNTVNLTSEEIRIAQIHANNALSKGDTNIGPRSHDNPALRKYANFLVAKAQRSRIIAGQSAAIGREEKRLGMTLSGAERKKFLKTQGIGTRKETIFSRAADAFEKRDKARGTFVAPVTRKTQIQSIDPTLQRPQMSFANVSDIAKTRVERFKERKGVRKITSFIKTQREKFQETKTSKKLKEEFKKEPVKPFEIDTRLFSNIEGKTKKREIPFKEFKFEKKLKEKFSGEGPGVDIRSGIEKREEIKSSSIEQRAQPKIQEAFEKRFASRITSGEITFEEAEKKFRDSVEFKNIVEKSQSNVLSERKIFKKSESGLPSIASGLALKGGTVFFPKDLGQQLKIGAVVSSAPLAISAFSKLPTAVRVGADVVDVGFGVRKFRRAGGDKEQKLIGALGIGVGTIGLGLERRASIIRKGTRLPKDANVRFEASFLRKTTVKTVPNPAKITRGKKQIVEATASGTTQITETFDPILKTTIADKKGKEVITFFSDDTGFIRGRKVVKSKLGKYGREIKTDFRKNPLTGEIDVEVFKGDKRISKFSQSPEGLPTFGLTEKVSKSKVIVEAQTTTPSKQKLISSTGVEALEQKLVSNIPKKMKADASLLTTRIDKQVISIDPAKQFKIIGAKVGKSTDIIATKETKRRVAKRAKKTATDEIRLLDATIKDGVIFQPGFATKSPRFVQTVTKDVVISGGGKLTQVTKARKLKAFEMKLLKDTRAQAQIAPLKLQTDVQVPEIASSKFLEGTTQIGIFPSQVKPRVVSGITFATPSKQIQTPFTRLKEQQKTKQETKLKTLTKLKVETLVKTKTDTKQETRLKTEQKLKARLRQRFNQQLRQDFRFDFDTTIRAPPTIIVPTGKTSTDAEDIIPEDEITQDPFNVFVRRFGSDVKVGTFFTKRQAKERLKQRLLGTLGASGIVKQRGKKVRVNLGGDFRASKVEALRVVQKRGKRLSRRQETKEIQFFKTKKSNSNRRFLLG